MNIVSRLLQCLVWMPLLLVVVACASSTAGSGDGGRESLHSIPAESPAFNAPSQADTPAVVQEGRRDSGVVASAKRTGLASGGGPETRYTRAITVARQGQGSPSVSAVHQPVEASGTPYETPARFDEDLEAYLIGPRDLLQIRVFEVDELSSKVRVSRRGSITMPLIGKVPVAGHNITEVEHLIEQRLAEEYLQDPHVAVFIEEFASQKLTVEGYVKKPGVFAMEGRTTLLQAIAMAGGVGDIADTDQIFVFRNPYGKNRVVLEFNLDDIEDGKQTDPLLQGTDIVVVDSSSGRRLLKDVTGTMRGFVSLGALPVF